MAEWSKALAWKVSIRQKRIEGSNPSRSATYALFRWRAASACPTEPRILAILDWELSTLAHPLADFAYHAMMYRMPPLIVPGLAGAELSALNIPGEAAYLGAYCWRTGRAALAGYDFALAFNIFRFAAILHGIRGRVLRGTAVNAEARARGDAFPALAALGWEQALRAGAGCGRR